MIEIEIRARALLETWEISRLAKPREHVLDIQLDKDHITLSADLLCKNLLWCKDTNHLTEMCDEFELLLTQFNDKILIELLIGGTA